MLLMLIMLLMLFMLLMLLMLLHPGGWVQAMSGPPAGGLHNGAGTPGGVHHVQHGAGVHHVHHGGGVQHAYQGGVDHDGGPPTYSAATTALQEKA